MLNRIKAFSFLTVLTATISVIPIASAEAQARIMWAGETYVDLSDSDSVDGFLTIQGFLNEGGFLITSVHLDGATLRCRKSQTEMTQEFAEEHVVNVTPKANAFVVQVLGVDDGTAYAVSGRIQRDNSLRATVTVSRSRVFFTGPNDADANVELCTARLAVRSPLFFID